MQHTSALLYRMLGKGAMTFPFFTGSLGCQFGRKYFHFS